MRGRDIKRYGYEFADLWLINTHNGVKEKGIKPILIDDYPAIKKHLDSFYPSLEKRSDKGDTPYNLRNCAYIDDFFKPKIVWIELTDKPCFYLDTSCFYPEATTFFMTSKHHLEYLIAFLNSDLCEWYFDKICATSGAGTRRWKKVYVEQIPIPKVDDDLCEKMKELVSQMQEIKSNKRDIGFNIVDSVNGLLYTLYDLSLDEIELIESGI